MPDVFVVEAEHDCCCCGKFPNSGSSQRQEDYRVKLGSGQGSEGCWCDCYCACIAYDERYWSGDPVRCDAGTACDPALHPECAWYLRGSHRSEIRDCQVEAQVQAGLDEDICLPPCEEYWARY